MFTVIIYFQIKKHGIIRSSANEILARIYSALWNIFTLKNSRTNFFKSGTLHSCSNNVDLGQSHSSCVEVEVQFQLIQSSTANQMQINSHLVMTEKYSSDSCWINRNQIAFTRKIFFLFLLSQPVSDCIYHFSIDIDLNWILFRLKRIERYA